MSPAIHHHSSSSLPRPLVLVSAALAAVLALGCAVDTEASGAGDPEQAAIESSEQGVTSAKEPAIDVKATWRRAVTGTPTYGYDATEPFLTIEVIVDDAALRQRVSGFDGLERPFALFPRKDASGAVRWERAYLGYRGQSLRGYYGQIRVDRYDVRDLRLSEQDLEAVLGLGVAVGLETNRGTVWAQDSGSNFAVERVGL